MRTEYNSIIYIFQIFFKYEEQAKGQRKVKVLQIGYKTVSQTMGNQKQKENKLEIQRGEKVPSAKLVIEVQKEWE